MLYLFFGKECLSSTNEIKSMLDYGRRHDNTISGSRLMNHDA